MTTDSSSGIIALNRYGLGARPNDTPPANPQAWLLDQFANYDPHSGPWSALPSSTAIAGDLGQRRMELRREGGGKKAAGSDTGKQGNAAGRADDSRQAARKDLRVDIRDTYWAAVDARVVSALNTPTPFVERLVHFWSNHFAVSADKPEVAALAGAFEAEAIRPHVLGHFSDMLVAVEQHPAMQLFLDQNASVGPDSRAALRAAQRDPSKKRGLNENLARETMELHTLGVRTGYTQADVTEFARALTGWGIVGPRAAQMNTGGPRMNAGMAQANAGEPGSFIFRPALHEPGARTIMGRTYAQAGEEQALAVLRDLANSPATAQHLATKLARHFVSDNPPPETVERLAQAYTKSGGDLPSMYRALVASPQAWKPVDVKFKTPWEWMVSSLRGLGWQDMGKLRAAPLLTQLGQPIWRPGSPAGYDDNAASWAAPDALVRRVELAQRLASRGGDRLDPRALGHALMGSSLSTDTAAAIARAESVPTAVALLLVSPDFQRR
jgi:uncharacterized protein (DUF1800 family)